MSDDFNKIVPHTQAQPDDDRVARPTKIGVSPAPPLLPLPSEATRTYHPNRGFTPAEVDSAKGVIFGDRTSCSNPGARIPDWIDLL